MTSRDLENLFEKYGRISNIEIKRGGYAFVEYGNNTK